MLKLKLKHYSVIILVALVLAAVGWTIYYQYALSSTAKPLVAAGELLSSNDTGYVTPRGRNDGIGACEWKSSHYLANYANCLLGCSRSTRGLDPAVCESQCVEKFTRDESKLDGCPVCLNADSQKNAVAMYQSFVKNTLMPSLYGTRTPSLATVSCEDRISNALDGLIWCENTAHLQRAIGEVKTADQTVEKEGRCISTYTASVSHISGCPAALTVEVANRIGNQAKTWMDKNSNIPFCQR